MSNFTKGQGAKIGIGFTNDLVGDVFTPEGGYEEKKFSNALIKAITCSDQYSTTYSADKAFDDSTSSYWRTDNIPSWIQIELSSPIAMTKFRWYIGNSSYYPKDFTLQGSNDGENFITIYEGLNPSGTGWKEYSFLNTQSYKYYRWNILSRNSSYVYLYEFEIYYKEFVNESAFTITGQQYRYVGGDLLDMIYQVISVEAHPTKEKAILLNFDTFNRFPTVEENITITYDATKGNLAGKGGAVQSFTKTFKPQELIPEPNPGIKEYLSAVPDIEVEFITIEYVNAYEKETITAVPDIEIEFIDVKIINP